jgi:hypothetical protein
VSLLNKKHDFYFGNRECKVKPRKTPQIVFTIHQKASIKNKYFPFQVLAHSTSWDEIDSSDVKLMQKHRSSLLGAELENDVYQKLVNLFSNRNIETSKRQSDETSKRLIIETLERRNDEMSNIFSNQKVETSERQNVETSEHQNVETSEHQNVKTLERRNDKTSKNFSNRKVENTIIFSGWKDNGSKEKTGTM